MKFKNNKQTSDTWVGQLIEPGAYYEIQTLELFNWQNNSKVLTDIASGDAIMNNGTTDILDVAEAINFLKNKDAAPRDSDGSLLSRTKITTSGWHYQLHGIEFKTATVDSFYSQKYDGSQHGFGVLTCLKSDGANGLVPCTNQMDASLNCIATQVDWEPTHDLEMIGGLLKIRTVPNQNLRLWVIGAPDVPEIYGGSKVFVTNVNLYFLGLEDGIRVDGRAPKYLTYDPVNHTNKMRLLLRHPAGFVHDVHMIFESFRQ